MTTATEKKPKRAAKKHALVPAVEAVAFNPYAMADKAIAVIRLFKNTKGDFAGKPFNLQPWQEEILRALFRLGPDGVRVVREAFIFLPRKNGKSELIAAIALFHLLFEGEGGAEVILGASDKDQASIVFRACEEMVRQDPRLMARCKPLPATRTITVPGTNKFLRAIPSDEGGAHGLNPSLVIGDELHAWRGRGLYDALRTGQGARSAPMFIVITTAGFDKHSICFERYDYACKVRDGIIIDPTFLPIIFEAKSTAYTERANGIEALEKLRGLCTCNHAQITLTNQLLREACARHVSIGSTGKIKPTTASDAPSIRTDPSGREASVPHVTSGPSSIEIPNTKSESLMEGRPGLQETPIESRLPAVAAERSPDGKSGQPRSAGLPSMDCPPNYSETCVPFRAASAASAKGEWLSSLTIVTAPAWFEGFCVPHVIQELVISETIRSVYDRHASTCNSRRATIRGTSLSVECPADDWTDESVWRKANPALRGVTPFRSISEMRRMCKEAQEIPAMQNAFRRLYLNQWTEQDVRWISTAAWAACGDLPDDFEGRECFGALDLSSTTDLAALLYLFPPAETSGRWDILVRFYVPKVGARRRAERDKVPYLQWIEQGHIVATEGEVIDYDRIKLDIADDAERFNIKEIAIDRWNATQLSTQLTGAGFTVVPFGQGFASMAAPSKEFEKMVIGKAYRHGGNPVLAWCAANVAVETDAAGNIKPSKKKSTERIDGIVALVMATGLAIVAQATLPSSYESEGITFLGDDD